jgi:signal transduction histidine kinase
MHPDLTFDNRVPEGVACRSDRHAFIRILDNLIGNAAKYNTPKGEVLLQLEGDVLSITDTGRGIRHPEKVFRRHYREGERGMGLGLHIVKKMCRKLGIGIRLESEEGKGTRVELMCEKVRVR